MNLRGYLDDLKGRFQQKPFYDFMIIFTIASDL